MDKRLKEHLDELLRLYDEARTTDEQERELADFFSQPHDTLPEEWEQYAALFTAFAESESLFSEAELEAMATPRTSRRLWPWLVGAAATVALLVGFFLHHPQTTEAPDYLATTEQPTPDTEELYITLEESPIVRIPTHSDSNKIERMEGIKDAMVTEAEPKTEPVPTVSPSAPDYSATTEQPAPDMEELDITLGESPIVRSIPTHSDSNKIERMEEIKDAMVAEAEPKTEPVPTVSPSDEERIGQAQVKRTDPKLTFNTPMSDVDKVLMPKDSNLSLFTGALNNGPGTATSKSRGTLPFGNQHKEKETIPAYVVSVNGELLPDSMNFLVKLSPNQLRDYFHFRGEVVEDFDYWVVKDETERQKYGDITKGKSTIVELRIRTIPSDKYLSQIIVEKQEGSITFVVDEGLEPIKGKKILMDGEKLAKYILSPDDLPSKQDIVATSFANEQNLQFLGKKDAFFRTVVTAYANHQSLVLSPDMIWLLISQGFARYVNAHPEELRPQLVEHDGKMDLVVVTDEELLTGNPDWGKIMGGFSDSIQKYTKGDIAKTITADFTTTTPVTRIASEITLMESVKSYFEYVVMYISCGIPSVTLQGTPEDWQLVLDKAKQLKPYGLTKWIEELEPILTEFVRTAEGMPDQLFWQRMVKEVRLPKLKGGGCDPGKPTELDGWVLKLFPDEQGVTLDKIPHTQDMPADHVRVDFKYQIIDPVQGSVVRETPMELWAGFIGAKEDTIANALMPKIGWLVRINDEDSTAHIMTPPPYTPGDTLSRN